jgi:hypothetical protein
VRHKCVDLISRVFAAQPDGSWIASLTVACSRNTLDLSFHQATPQLRRIRVPESAHGHRCSEKVTVTPDSRIAISDTLTHAMYLAKPISTWLIPARIAHRP